MNKPDRIIFGTDGWRGLLGEEVNLASVQRVAQAFASYMHLHGKTKKVAIGYDGREQSADFANAFAEVLSGNNIRVLLSEGIAPTPVVSYICLAAPCDAGVMVTASHNPAAYNGLKFKSYPGRPFFTEETARVEALLDKHEVTRSTSNITRTNMILPYLAHMEKRINFSAIREAGISVVIDSMSGAGGRILERILRKHQIAAKTIYGDPLADFSGRLAEPIEANLQPLAEILRQGHFSVGLATDGDADRLGVMTNAGNWMNIQECILYLADYYLNERKVAGPIIKTASVSDKLSNLSDRKPSAAVDVPVGFKYIAEAMLEKNAAFGAEESGGFGFKEHIPDRDGIFSALLFLEMMGSAGANGLESFIREKRLQHGHIHYARTDVRNNDPARHEALSRMTKAPPKRVGHVDVVQMQSYTNSRGLINGMKLKLQGNPRWLLVRVSETEPVIRFYAEGESADEVGDLLRAGEALLSDYM